MRQKKGFHKEMMSEGTKISSKRYYTTLFVYLTMFAVMMAIFNIELGHNEHGYYVTLEVNATTVENIINSLLIFIGTAIGITVAGKHKSFNTSNDEKLS